MKTFSRHQMEVHNDSRPIFTCEMCYSEFSRKFSLMHHLDKVHKDELHWIDEDKKAKFTDEDCQVSCQDCDKVFISEQSMKYHSLRNHSISILPQFTSSTRDLKSVKSKDGHLAKILEI